MTRLDLVDGTPVVWKNKPVGQSERVQRLAEMSTGLNYAEDN